MKAIRKKEKKKGSVVNKTDQKPYDRRIHRIIITA